MERGDDVRQLLATRLYHFVSNVAQPPVTFKLFPIGEQLSPHYRLATIQDVHDHRGALLRAMPSWEIANLDDGSVDGAMFGGHTRMEIRDDASEQLAMRLYQFDSDVAGPTVTFKLFCIGDQLPPQYRLATIKEVQDHQEALLRAMPGCEIANLADGSVDGAALGGCTRMEWKKDVNLQLAMELYPLVRPPLKFKLFHIGKQLPPQYRLATVQEVHDHRDALLRAMPTWEIANLADGSVDGASYGGHTRMERRNDVGHQLAVELQEPFVANITVGPPMTRFKLFRMCDQLPPQYRLATAEEVQDHREAFLKAMPKWEVAKLADGYVDGAFHGGRVSMEKLNAVGFQLAGMELQPDVSRRMKKKPMNFKLFDIGEKLSPMYRLATVQEVHHHRKEWIRAMPGWKIANLADGSVVGAAYGGHTRMERRNDVGHQLAVLEPMKFKLFHLGENIPPPYRLATIQEVQEYREAFLRTMPRWEIANLADGFVDGALYGGRTSKERLTDVGLQLAMKLDQRAGPPMTFKLLRIGDELPAQYRLAKGKEISDHREALLTTMPGLESTNMTSHFGNSSCNIGLDWIVIVCNSMATSTSGSYTSSCGGGHYIDVLPDDVVTSQIWPNLISSLHKSVRGQRDQYSAVNILWKLRLLNKDWMNLVDSSVEWAAFRLANSFINAAKYSTGVEDTFIKSRDFLCERTKLRKPCKLDLLMAPYPDLPDDFPPRGNHTSHNYLRLLRHANTVGPLESDGTSQESDQRC